MTNTDMVFGVDRKSFYGIGLRRAAIARHLKTIRRLVDSEADVLSPEFAAQVRQAQIALEQIAIEIAP
jgi:hypothetical protein